MSCDNITTLDNVVSDTILSRKLAHDKCHQIKVSDLAEYVTGILVQSMVCAMAGIL
jgi:hypothetical protein